MSRVRGADPPESTLKGYDIGVDVSIRETRRFLRVCVSPMNVIVVMCLVSDVAGAGRKRRCPISPLCFAISRRDPFPAKAKGESSSWRT